MSITCDVPGLMPLEQAMARIFATLDTIQHTEFIELNNALGRITAEDIVSPIEVPSFDNSAMDGYAIFSEESNLASPFTIVGKSFAGEPFTSAIGKGECVRIMTGGVIPEGADAVVMQENTETRNGKVHINHPPKHGEAIRRAGSDIAIGDTVLKQGKTISPIDIGLLASLGLRTVSVVRQLKVAVFSTGDELLEAGELLRPGCIYDSNRAMLSAMLRALNYQVIDFGKVADDKSKLRETFKLADQQADVVITTGGVSVGEADYTKLILDELGEIGFWKIAMKPGKPLAFGKLPNSYFFGLPGNPVSAAATFVQVARPALARLAGSTIDKSFSLIAVADCQFKKRPGRLDFQRSVCWLDETGVLRVRPFGTQSSGVLSSFSNSNCFTVLEQQRGNVKAGEQVMIQRYDQLLE